MTDLQEGVWVKGRWTLNPSSGAQSIEGLVLNVEETDERVLTVMNSNGQRRIAFLDLPFSIEPAPMPEPPDGSILEWTEPGHVEPYLAHRIGAEWFRTGVAWPVDWSDLGLGTPECPVHVVRWGAR